MQEDHTLKDQLQKDGYSKEDQYFYEQDLKLKQKLKEEQKKRALTPASSPPPEPDLKKKPANQDSV